MRDRLRHLRDRGVLGGVIVGAVIVWITGPLPWILRLVLGFAAATVLVAETRWERANPRNERKARRAIGAIVGWWLSAFGALLALAAPVFIPNWGIVATSAVAGVVLFALGLPGPREAIEVARRR